MNNEKIFNKIRYSNVWEDGEILCEALAPSARQGRILSIASSGDNALALLTLDPKEIIAIDLSVPQLACLDLRIAAIMELHDLRLYEFLGILPSEDRMDVYRSRLQSRLSSDAKAFWDSQPQLIENGIIHAGKFERYFRIFRTWILPLIHSNASIQKLLEIKSRDEQLQFYERTWNSRRWRWLFKFFFSRRVMGQAGRDPSFFAHVEGAVAERIMDRTRRALVECPTHSNPFLHYILTGNFSLDHLPRYLQPQHLLSIRSRIDRIKLVHGSATDAQGPFDAFNLSDIFEYMGDDAFALSYEKILNLAAPNARIAYWNMLVERKCPIQCQSRIAPLEETASSLHSQDRAWFYQKFILEEVEP